MLVAFPLAFLSGAFLFDLGAAATGSEDLTVAAWVLMPAGVIMGLLAALPGLIDYRYTVPPASSARKRATKHAAINLSALFLFSLAWWLRGGPGVAPEGVLLGIEAIGSGLLAVGGWHGGVLAFRNQIGVDHRYAGAGKWREEAFPRGDGWLRVGATDELEPGQLKLLRIGGDRLVLANTGTGHVVFSDPCSHRGGSLAGGTLARDRVVCPWHGSQFNVHTGEVVAGPATTAIPVYPVEIRGTDIFLLLSGQPGP
jgi:nitrite reductase/ring-hydroxylating ferredoxin subunit/uncharacterized membrane protein